MAKKEETKSSIKKQITILSVIITLFLLLTIILIGMNLNKNRENSLNSEVSQLYQEFYNMQTFTLLSQAYDDQMACIAFESKLKELDESIWALGEKIDKYRAASEEFQKDQFYLSQKKTFNENEVLYYLLMKELTKKCNITKYTLLFFYQNSADCKKCDDQSFVLSDINAIDDLRAGNEIAIFSFDMDLNITTLKVLGKYHQIEQMPCVVFADGDTKCGMLDKDFIINKMCQDNANLKICSPNIRNLKIDRNLFLPRG